MTSTHQYRHQLHYQITQADYSALRSRLCAAAPDEIGSACVHMLRFDSYRPLPKDSDEPRFSLYYYDNDPSFVFLERRLGTERTSAMVVEAECRALLAGETEWLLDRPNPVFQDFYTGLKDRMLLPQVLLTFHREFYTLDNLDIWVALDTNVRSSLQHMDFLDPELLERDSTGQDGPLHMEISYSDTIPDDVLSIFVETAPKRKPLVRVALPT